MFSSIGRSVGGLENDCIIPGTYLGLGVSRGAAAVLHHCILDPAPSDSSFHRLKALRVSRNAAVMHHFIFVPATPDPSLHRLEAYSEVCRKRFDCCCFFAMLLVLLYDSFSAAGTVYSSSGSPSKAGLVSVARYGSACEIA